MQKSISWFLILIALGAVACFGLQDDARQFEELKPAVVYSEGIYGLEKSKESTWRWLGDGLPKAEGPVPLKGLVHLLNTKKDSLLTIAGAVPSMPKPRVIGFFFNGERVDEFTVSNDRFDKTYQIPASKQSREEYSELLITIDQFAIPMEREKKSQDNRRLGMRLTKLTWSAKDGNNPTAAAPNLVEPAVEVLPRARPGSWWIALLGIALVVFALVLALAIYQVQRTRKSAAIAEDEDLPPRDEEPAKPIHFRCSECGKSVVAKAALMGKKVKCPHCRHAVLVVNPPTS